RGARRLRRDCDDEPLDVSVAVSRTPHDGLLASRVRRPDDRLDDPPDGRPSDSSSEADRTDRPIGVNPDPEPREPYSSASATTGSTREARRAGTYEAASATSASNVAEPPSVAGSAGLTA